MSRFHSTKKSFGYAFDGFRAAAKNEPNFQTHLAAALIVLVLAAFLGFGSLEWGLLFFSISLVILLELVNTSVEAVVDLVQPEIHPKAKIAKDVAAAAVLFAAFQAVVIGIVLFTPYLLPLVL